MRAVLRGSKYVRHAAPHARTLTRVQGRALFDKAARRNLGMSGSDFLSRYDAGQIQNPDRPEVMRVLLLRPFADQ